MLTPVLMFNLGLTVLCGGPSGSVKFIGIDIDYFCFCNSVLLVDVVLH